MRRVWIAGLGLLAALVVSVGVSVAFGSAAIGWTDVYRVLGHRLLGLGSPIERPHRAIAG